MGDNDSAMAAKIPATMRAIALAKFCKPAEYNLATLPVPKIAKPDELLIKVHAASVNPVDVKMASGFGKLMEPSTTFPYKLGYDVSGTVVATGSSITTFKQGDEVYSRVPNSYRGTLAQYALTPLSHVALKPTSLTHTEAASIPLAAQTAFQALLHANSILPGGLRGKTVFIPGGLSGTGSFAVQIAKKYFEAAKVVTTLSTKKIAIVNEVIGEGVLDQVVDYTKGAKGVVQEVGKGSVDFMFDPVGQSLSLVAVMKKNGLILSISTLPSGSQMQETHPNLKWWLAIFLNVAAWGISRYIEGWCGVKYSYFNLKANGKDLKTLAEMVDEGKLKPVVGEVVKLENLEGVKNGCQKVLDGKGGVGKFVVEVV